MMVKSAATMFRSISCPRMTSRLVVVVTSNIRLAIAPAAKERRNRQHRNRVSSSAARMRPSVGTPIHCRAIMVAVSAPASRAAVPQRCSKRPEMYTVIRSSA